MSAGVRLSKIRGHPPYFLLIIIIIIIIFITFLHHHHHHLHHHHKVLQYHTIIKTILIIMCESQSAAPLRGHPTHHWQGGERGGRGEDKEENHIDRLFPPAVCPPFLPGRVFHSFANSAVFAFAETKQCLDPGGGRNLTSAFGPALG